MRRSLLIVALAALMVIAFGASAAFAGEWNKGHFNAPGGDLPAKYNANSECLFNGLDEPDESSFGEGDGEPMFFPGFGDDAFWGLKPGQSVQTAGHAIRLGLSEPGEAGIACNGHLHPLK